MGQLWNIVQAHRDRYGPSVSEVARRMDTGPQTLFNWRDRELRSLPSFEVLQALARVTGLSYDVVLDAALDDIGYKRMKKGESDEEPGTTRAG